MREEPESANFIPKTLDLLRRHWIFAALFLISITAGALVGAFQIPEEISLLRRTLGGAICGGGIAFLMTATKMFA